MDLLSGKAGRAGFMYSSYLYENIYDGDVSNLVFSYDLYNRISDRGYLKGNDENVHYVEGMRNSIVAVIDNHIRSAVKVCIGLDGIDEFLKNCEGI